ncbi:2423_t:CDS:2 [Paraglomus occultum]|uniref:2423_t:CDS:1 n=1 Tax=Paraglomus occultum TaxID=144539 RepID=A0A9N9FF33_9GLOM|nr:2423_t:CDS:2 [Paraglomus occultum]
MKLPSLLLLFLVTTLLFLTYPYHTAALTCYDNVNPLRRNQHVPVECDNNKLGKRTSVSWIKGLRSWMPFASKTLKRDVGTNAFKITLTCSAGTTLCAKVKNAFDLAGLMLSQTLQLNTAITVNATFLNFCKQMNQCTAGGGYLTLGGAAPARTIPMKDDDQAVRLYPQALVKQQTSDPSINFGAYDIVALFNSEANFWFQGDGAIQHTQSDFLFVILHELVHGLGFTSSWDDYINITPEALTPDVSITSKGGQQTIGFTEYAFDKYMVLSQTGQRMSEITAQLNQFSASSGATTVQQFGRAFKNSPQYSLAVQMFRNATTRNAMVFLPAGQSDISQAVILETSLAPYQQGSSVSHVDYNTYTDTPDFLMRYLQDRGVSLGDAIVQGGNYTGGSIGPKLKLVLESLGYATQDNPNPYRPAPSSSDSPVILVQSKTLVFLIVFMTIFLSRNTWNL